MPRLRPSPESIELDPVIREAQGLPPDAYAQGDRRKANEAKSILSLCGLYTAPIQDQDSEEDSGSLGLSEVCG